MDDKEYQRNIDALKHMSDLVKNDPTNALKFLVKAGIYDIHGNLMPPYTDKDVKFKEYPPPPYKDFLDK